MPHSLSVTDIIHQRKTTKAFAAGQTLTPAQAAAVRDLLRMCPSSTNTQPWHFFMATNEAAKSRIAKGTTGGFAYNTPKIMNAAQVIVLCARTRIDEPYLQAVLDQEIKDGRLATDEARTNQHNLRAGYIQHHTAAGSLEAWASNQVYIALGFLLLGVANLGIDACPMEGFDSAAIDAELGLPEQGLKSVLLVALGQKSDADFNAALPKSRLAEAALISEL